MCHLSQLTKGFNLQIFIGFVPTQKQAADLGTKFYPGLVNNVNSFLWQHGSPDKSIHLLADSTTYLSACDGNVTWSAISQNCSVINCKSEHCKNSATSNCETIFGECNSCDSEYWQPFKCLFLRDEKSSLDLDSDTDASSLHEIPLSTQVNVKLG